MSIALGLLRHFGVLCCALGTLWAADTNMDFDTTDALPSKYGFTFVSVPTVPESSCFSIANGLLIANPINSSCAYRQNNLINSSQTFVLEIRLRTFDVWSFYVSDFPNILLFITPNSTSVPGTGRTNLFPFVPGSIFHTYRLTYTASLKTLQLTIDGVLHDETTIQPSSGTSNLVLLEAAGGYGSGGSGWQMDYFHLSSTPVVQPCSSVNIDRSQSNNQLDISITSSCDAVLTIKNNKNYWTNFQISSVGSATAVPVGGNTNLYATYAILPPSGLVGTSSAVQYNVHFSRSGDSLSIYVDPTGQTGNGAAKWMNIVQVVLNSTPAIGSVPQLVVGNYQLVAQAFAQMPHLNNAAAALFSNPPQALSFLKELGLFFASLDELSVFATLIENLANSNGVAFAKAGFLEKLKSLVGWPIRIVYAAIQVFGNVFDFVFRYPTGSVVLTGQP